MATALGEIHIVKIGRMKDVQRRREPGERGIEKPSGEKKNAWRKKLINGNLNSGDERKRFARTCMPRLGAKGKKKVFPKRIHRVMPSIGMAKVARPSR